MMFISEKYTGAINKQVCSLANTVDLVVFVFKI